MNTQAEERILIEVAKQEHRETTAAAERALQVGSCVPPQQQGGMPPPPRPSSGPQVRERRRLFCAQIAVTTAETARATVEELHRQGRQLECADEGVNQVWLKRTLWAG